MYFKKIPTIFILVLSLLLMSCGSSNENSSSVAETETETETETEDTITLTLLTTSPGSDPNPHVRVSGVKSGDVVKLYTDSACTAQVASDTATGTSIDLTTLELNMSQEYSFYASVKPLGEELFCSASTVTYELTLLGPAPLPPTALSIVDTTSANRPWLSVRVLNFVAGIVVKIYLEPTCTTPVGRSSSRVSGTVRVRPDRPFVEDGQYTFYATVAEVGTQDSDCSEASVTYTLDTSTPEAPTIAEPLPTITGANIAAYPVSGTCSIESNLPISFEIKSLNSSGSVTNFKNDAVICISGQWEARAVLDGSDPLYPAIESTANNARIDAWVHNFSGPNSSKVVKTIIVDLP